MGSLLRYEWRRITTIRSTWVLLGLYVLSVAGFAYLTAVVLPGAFEGANGEPGLPSTIALSTVLGVGTNYVSVVFLLTVAAQVFGHEYRYGLIRLTLTAFPQRGQVFAAKAGMLVLWITKAFAVGVLVAWAIALMAGSKVEQQPLSTVAGEVVRAWLFVVGFCLIAFAVSALTRNVALGVVIPLVWAAIFEGLLLSFLGSRLPWLSDVLPFSSGTAFTAGESLPRSGLVYGAWVVAAVAAAFVALEKRDA
jgi:ABC-type transport system involved in multi-copper enzyme maturation permease subunit